MSNACAIIVDLFIADGVTDFTSLGVTSEVARRTEAERDAVLDRGVAHVNGRMPIVAATTAEGLGTCIAYTRRAQAAASSAVMISPPRMPKINSDSVVRHFADVPAAVDIPIIVQDYPPISGYATKAALVTRIASDEPAARTIELEEFNRPPSSRIDTPCRGAQPNDPTRPSQARPQRS